MSQLTASCDMNSAFTGLNDVIESELERDPHAVGCGVAVIHDQSILWSGGFGLANIQEDRAADADSVFGLGSISKVFIAMALYKLRDALALNLDAPVNEYLPEFRVCDDFPKAMPITIRQLMLHRSGLPLEAPLKFWDTLDFPDDAALMACIPSARLHCPPMAAYHYSNFGYAILGCLISRVTGMPFFEYIRKSILDPLGMLSSGFYLPEELSSDKVQGYVHHAPSGAFVPTLWPDMRTYAAAMQFMSTPNDFAKFVSLQFRYSGPGDGDVILGATLQEMHTPTYIQDDWNSGIGVSWSLRRVRDETVHRHDGSTIGFRAACSVSMRHKLGVCVFSNSINSSVHSLRQRLLEELLPQFQGRNDDSVSPIRSANGDDADFSRYSGTYYHPVGMAIGFKLDKGALLLVDPDSKYKVVAKLAYEGEHAFRIVQGICVGESIVFNCSDGVHANSVSLSGYSYFRS